MSNKTVRRRRRQAGSVRPKVKRPKTFKSEESAKAYAEKNKIKDYKLINLRSSDSKDKKLKIVVG